MWHQVKVVFILKPGKSSYCGPRDFRPISLTLFLLKTMERLVDRFFKDEILAFHPLHPNQQCIPSWEVYGNDPSSARGMG